MRRTALGACLLAFVVLTMPARSPAPEETSQPEKSQKAEPPKKERLLAIGVFGGKVLSVDEDGQSFLLRVYGQTPDLRFTPGNPAAC
jgi:hypothetical protein